MAAEKQHLELFHERFVTFNLDRYKDDPTMKAKFTNLTFDMVSYTNVAPAQPAGRFGCSVYSAARRFKGDDQTWTPADAATDLKLWTPVSEDPLASVDKLAEQEETGIYFYVDGEDIKVGVVIPANVDSIDLDDVIKATVNAGLVYAIPEILPEEASNTVTLNGQTFLGTLVWSYGLAPVDVIPTTDYGQLKGQE